MDRPGSDAGSPSRKRWRTIVLLRGMLLVAVGALLVDAGVTAAGWGAPALLVVFALTEAALPWIPERRNGARGLELAVGALDLALVGLGVLLAGAGRGALPVSCLLMVLVVALANRTAQAVGGAAAVSALHAWLVPVTGFGTESGRQLALQILFLCAVGLYYGVLVGPVHARRLRREAEALEARDLGVLLEILEAVSSSLDLRQVARRVVTRLNELVPSVRCSLVYISERRGHCTVVASHDAPELQTIELDLAEYPEIRRAMETRSPVVVDDVLDHPLMEDVRDRVRSKGYRSLLVVPLIFGDDLLGTLCLRTSRSRETLSAREIQLCEAAARASANALKNALLHRQALLDAARRRASGEKLKRVLDHSPDLILTTDPQGTITEFSRGAERLLGYRKDEVLDRDCSMLLVDQEPQRLLEAALTSVVRPEYGCRLRRKDGTELEFDLHLAALTNARDEVIGTVWIGRDVTELKSAQHRLLQAEKLSTIGEVISGVAHELNNPLSAVVGFSQLLMARHGEGPLSRQLEKINDSALRCQKIVRNLLSFARAHKPERKLLGVNGIIEKTLDLKKYQLRVNNIEVETALDPDVPGTLVDYHQLQQVLMNLINNAQHAMAGKPGRLRIATSVAGGMIRITVADNGEGMDEATLEKIFDPFFTTKGQGEGTGLGLSVSYGIVNEHGGRIRASSRPGEGATFFVELPIVRAAGEAEDDDAGPRAPITGGGPESRILVVDDEPMILDLLLDVLEELGHRVDTAANGREAFRKVESCEYDLVITDVRMPQMNGLELYRRMLGARPELEKKVIFITGDLMDNETVEFLAGLNARTLAKPLDIDKIAEEIDRALRGGP